MHLNPFIGIRGYSRVKRATLSPVILVTGASGFVGTALCAALIKGGWIVRGIVRNMKNAEKICNYEIVQVGDIGNINDWDALLDGVDVVVHLAGRVHLMQDEALDPLTEYRKINALATAVLARAAAKHRVGKFIYLSTIKVNGEETSLGKSFTADDVPNPKDPYGVSKLEAEKSLMDISRLDGLGVTIIRPPLVYGPGVKANFFKMMRWLIFQVPLPFGGIHNLRSLVSIDNLVDLILTCIDHPLAANQIFLVSDGEDLSTANLLTRMGNALGVPARLISVPVLWINFFAALFGRRDMAQRLCASLRVDISKTREVLGWAPKISLDEGLRRTAQAYLTKL